MTKISEAVQAEAEIDKCDGELLAARALSGRDTRLDSDWLDAGYDCPEEAAAVMLGDYPGTPEATAIAIAIVADAIG